MTLTVRILIGMVAGILIGIGVQLSGVSQTHWISEFLVHGVFDVGGQLFIASLQLMVVPLVLVSLVCGASSLGGGAGMGRLGGKTIGLYLFTTAMAVSIALASALAISPGEGIDKPQETFVPAPSPGCRAGPRRARDRGHPGSTADATARAPGAPGRAVPARARTPRALRAAGPGRGAARGRRPGRYSR